MSAPGEGPRPAGIDIARVASVADTRCIAKATSLTEATT